MRWLSWFPSLLTVNPADGPSARRAILLRRLHQTNLRRTRTLLLAVVAINLVVLGLMCCTSNQIRGLIMSEALRVVLIAHRVLWIVLDLAIVVFIGRIKSGQDSPARLGQLATAVIVANMILVISLILPVYPQYHTVSLFYVAMFCLVPLIRLDARESYLAIGLPALLLIAGVLHDDPRLAVNISNAVNLLTMAALSLIGMRFLYVERVRDLLQQDIISRQQAELGRLALTDELTGLANRRGLNACLDREWRRSGREGTALAAIMIDIDHFKQYNDTSGHAAGDACLRLVAATLSGCLRRAGDMVGRYGGEEFVVLLPGVDMAGAGTLAETIRLAVQERNQPHPGSPFSRVTVSLGVAVRLAGAFDTPQALLARADAAMYAAKAAGRNRTCLADAPAAPAPPSGTVRMGSSGLDA
jgi:diguanylate cyclase (GGDEF)-like protein